MASLVLKPPGELVKKSGTLLVTCLVGAQVDVLIYTRGANDRVIHGLLCCEGFFRLVDG